VLKKEEEETVVCMEFLRENPGVKCLLPLWRKIHH